VRICTTTRPGASPRPISITTAPEISLRSGHGWAPSSPAGVSVNGLLPNGAAVLVSDGLQAAPSGWGADLTPGAARPIPLAAPRHATRTEGPEVRL
jgi:hypothetical protein